MNGNFVLAVALSLSRDNGGANSVWLRFYHNGGRRPKVLHRFRDRKRSADAAPLHVRDSASPAHQRGLALSCRRMRLGRSYRHCASERFCANPLGVLWAPSFGR